MTGADTHLSDLFTEFIATTHRRAPLYARIAKLCVDAPWCHELMAAAPPLQRLPVLWCASLHRLCLGHLHDDLAKYFVADYGQRADPEELTAEALKDFCARHAQALRHLVSTRRTQTNEVGRSALLLPILGLLESETAQPLRLLDVGSSAGLTLNLDRYSYEYEPGGQLRSEMGAPVLRCGIRGEVPIPAQLPRIIARRGLDLDPVDLDDPEDELWLRACVWADQTDRSRQLAEALAVARSHRVEVRRADAVADLRRELEDFEGPGHLVVITTWVLNYLSDTQIAEFFATLENHARHRDLTWLGAEQPDQIAPVEVETRGSQRHLTHLVTRAWRAGRAQQTTWATAHPHGYWMHWESDPRS